jgi:nicotinamidase/pyrazinamidase
MKTALIVVDVQRDFCPGGALGVEEGDLVVEPANMLIRHFAANRAPVFFTRDWHPPDHCSFKENGGIWPPHCIANTPGAEFHPQLVLPENAIIVSKATTPDQDAYSGFEGTDLAKQLAEQEVREVVVVGLATDYCVKHTVLDALRNGLETMVAIDAVRAVNAKTDDGRRAITLMQIRGARFEAAEKLVSGGPLV